MKVTAKTRLGMIKIMFLMNIELLELGKLGIETATIEPRNVPTDDTINSKKGFIFRTFLLVTYIIEVTNAATKKLISKICNEKINIFKKLRLFAFQVTQDI